MGCQRLRSNGRNIWFAEDFGTMEDMTTIISMKTVKDFIYFLTEQLATLFMRKVTVLEYSYRLLMRR